MEIVAMQIATSKRALYGKTIDNREVGNWDFHKKVNLLPKRIKGAN